MEGGRVVGVLLRNCHGRHVGGTNRSAAVTREINVTARGRDGPEESCDEGRQ